MLVRQYHTTNLFYKSPLTPRSAFKYVAGAIGASSDEIKLIFSFLISYPLAGLLKRIPDQKPNQKNLFIVAVSLFYFIGLFDLYDGLRTFLYSAIGTYAIAYYVDGSLMPWIVFFYLVRSLHQYPSPVPPFPKTSC